MSLFADLQVIYCDNALLVVNKPAGLSTLPDGYNPTLPHIKSLLEREHGRLWIVHRLDKETSGVLILARDAQAHRSLNTQFEQHRVSKVYHALVKGDLQWQEKTVDLPLHPNGDRRHRTVIDPQHGKPAITHFRVLERLGPYSLVEAIPETGRTHQIRAHLSAIGVSILGDKLYTRKDKINQQAGITTFEQVSSTGGLPTPSIALHALSVEIDHPLTGERMKFTAPYPAELFGLLQQLRATTIK